ncbi:ImmA/IrrE family metallo-endopeptidase [Microbulbifer pacificus]|uniref:ImmA/IrrE family metallo-endopeptidase n=1 Tax=Microbulbifer pacificus TaxID=407164 RepID=UPI0018F8A1FA|nr:ImmA/IrrE family metallo-endopeptidase [Microbulbifer pacificus]
MYSHLEDYIFRIFSSIGVEQPKDLDMHTIANKLGVEITYQKRAFRLDNEIVLVKSTARIEWMIFGHEACHYLRHSGNQLLMNQLFFDLQEWQADHFAYHFCVPTFMLDQLGEISVYDIVNLFNVDFEFAIKRLEMYQNKQYIRERYHENYLIGY